jgi:hypothetical protein
MANMSENFVFIYLGLTIFTKADELFRWGLIFFTLFFILIARASRYNNFNFYILVKHSPQCFPAGLDDKLIYSRAKDWYMEIHT